jgi:thioester reductase-like protein
MRTILFTGFPGFLGSGLLPRLLRRSEDVHALCVVQSKFAPTARERLRAVEAAEPLLRGRIRLLPGDVTAPLLRLRDFDRLAAEITEIFHLAAVYDLSVPSALAEHVNVGGTRHVLDAAERCPQLRRLHYVSTCYVSGRYAGIFRETDLDRGQSFHNFYEETKFLAEVAVQERMKQGLAATIYRPAIVVGDSRTGATQKYDGPYYVIRWLLRQPGIAILPVVGDPSAFRVNVVPSDFVVAAIDHLSGLESSVGTVYQLADPEPLTVDELIEEAGRATARRVVRLPLPLSLARAAIDWVPLVERVMQIPSSAIDYFVHPTHYTCDNALRDLAGTDIRVPPLPSYLGRLVEFARTHPEIGATAMA